MASHITLSPSRRSQQLAIRSAEFPGDTFLYTIPEAIGSTAHAVWGMARHTLMEPTWTVTDETEYSYDWPSRFAQNRSGTTWTSASG
jgi:hypothetical protein